MNDFGYAKEWDDDVFSEAWGQVWGVGRDKAPE